jgi:hypothetical protein
MRDPKVSRYIRDRAPFARPILIHLRGVIHRASPDIDEGIKWGMPSFLYQGKILCGIAGFKAHCALWFWEGKAVVGNKTKDGMGNFGRITDVKDLPSDAKIIGFVKKAMTRI